MGIVKVPFRELDIDTEYAVVTATITDKQVYLSRSPKEYIDSYLKSAGFLPSRDGIINQVKYNERIGQRIFTQFIPLKKM